MYPDIKFDFNKIKFLEKDLQDAEDRIPGFIKNYMREVGMEMVQRTMETFMLQGERGGRKRWLESYGSKKRGGNSTLIDTGRLMNSITMTRFDANGFEVSTGVEYGWKHQLGLKGQVARPFMFWAPDGSDMDMVVDTYNRLFSTTLSSGGMF